MPHRPAMHCRRATFSASLLATTSSDSLRWRTNFIRTYLERDIPQFDPRIAAETLRRFWVMLAWQQGGLLNSADFARNLGVDVKTINRHIDLLVNMMLVRRPAPGHNNIGKRIDNSTKLYMHDSNLLVDLLSIPDKEALFSYPVIGKSQECFFGRKHFCLIIGKYPGLFLPNRRMRRN